MYRECRLVVHWRFQGDTYYIIEQSARRRDQKFLNSEGSLRAAAEEDIAYSEGPGIEVHRLSRQDNALGKG